MKLRSYTVLVALATMVCIASAGADVVLMSSSTITASIGDVSLSSSETKLSGDNIRFAQILSSSYNRTVSPSELIRLKADFDFGFGDISLLYVSFCSFRPIH